jgi:integrase
LPLSDLAVEIIREALDDGRDHVFASPIGDQPMNRKVMATALRGTKYKGKVKTPGICALLGLRPFTPHDLRRTAGDLGFDDAWIAKCLDHAASKKQEQIVPSVTGKVSNHSKRMKEKRGAGRRRSGASADHRRARRNRTASRRLTLGMAMSPLSSKADIATALQHGKRNVSRAAPP